MPAPADSGDDAVADRLHDVVLAVAGVAALNPVAVGAPRRPRVRDQGSHLSVLVRLSTAAGASTPTVAREVAEAVRRFLLVEGTPATIEVQVGGIG